MPSIQTKLRKHGRIRRTILLLCLLGSACASQVRTQPSGIVVLAFPHGGRSGAAGLQADNGARLALEGSAFAALSIDLDSGVQNPHEDEGTDDERAVARVDAALGSYGTESNVVGAVTGPTQAIVRAALSAPVRFPVVGAVEGSSATLAQMPRALREEYHARYREPASVASWAGYQAARALLRRIGP